jgi:putative ABC transport system permease protein
MARDLNSRPTMDSLLNDLRHALRSLRSKPGFTAIAVATLALGIGGSTAIFGLTSAVLLAKPPLRDPDRLVTIWENASAAGFPRNQLAPATYAFLRDNVQAFEGVAAVSEAGFTLTGEGEPQKVEGRRVTASFFDVLGVPPALGRALEPADDRPGAPHVAVISHGLWQRRFGGDPGVVGRDVLMNGDKYTVVGVMPRDFQFMESYVALWVPAAFDAEELAKRAHYLTVVARMKPGVAAAAVQAEVEAIAARYARQFPGEISPTFVLPFREQIVGDARQPLIVLALAITFVLLITCANVAALLLARTASRGREIAVRSALGATRTRIVRQLLTESLLLAAIGGGLALLVASFALSSLQQLVPPGLVLAVHPTLDGRALALALVLSAGTGLLFGLAPAVQATRGDLNVALRQGGRGMTGAGHRRLRSALVVGELAATLMLLVGAGLLGQTLYRLRYADLGLRPERLLTLRTPLPLYKYAEASRRAAFYEDVLDRVRRLPGVVSAGYSTSVPLEWKGGTNGFEPEGAVDPRRTYGAGPVDPRLSYDANHRQVSTDYLRTMGIPLRRGRFLERTDGERTQPVAIVNETMARQYWPGVDAVGKRFRTGNDTWITIVGVVGDVRQMGLDAPVKAEMYFPYAQVDGQPWFAPRDLVVRSASVEPMSLVPAVKEAIRAVDPEQAVANVRTYDEVLDEEVVQRRLGASLVAAFAGLALLLASLGVYGVLSYFVAQHTSEIGVRLALGASRRDIFSLVLGKGMALAASGVALGLVGALALTRLVSSLLYGVGAADPATFAGAAGLLAALAMLACYLPARRAIKVDPMVAIRCE